MKTFPEIYAEHEHKGERRRAVDFFSDKFTDAMLFGDLKRLVAAKTDTILFNICRQR